MGRLLPRVVASALILSLCPGVWAGQGTSAAQAGTGSSTAAPAGGSQAPEAQITTLHLRSNLVVIDVVVNDNKGKPVHGLTAESFTLTENGKPQMLRHVDEHTAGGGQERLAAPPPKLPPGLFTNQAPVIAGGPVNVLLLDYLNTPLTAQPYARQQLIEYLNKAPAGQKIAIFALSTSLVMLQGFSSNPEVLKAALTGKKGAPQASSILSDPVFGGPQGNTVLSDTFQSDALDAAQQLANIQQSQALEAAFEQDLRAKITLGAFETLARYLTGIPGRKNVIWYSGSFPLSVEPQTDLTYAFDSVVRNDEEVRKADNLLARAQVAVYPVDARGLFNDPANGAQNGAAGGAPKADAQMAFLQQTAQEQETMFKMAEDTGGKAFVNTNDLKSAVGQAIEAGSNYYTLTYTPTNAQWDGRFRAIKVKVDQPGVKLAYRTGYYADDPDDRNQVVAGRSAMAAVRPSGMTTAMLRGAPEPTEILFKMRVRPAPVPPSETVVAGNKTNSDPKLDVHGPYQAYGVDLVPDRQDIKCPVEANNVRRCRFEIASYVYNRDGQLLVISVVRTGAVLTADKYNEVQAKGMAFHQVVSVPVKGDYYIRTAIHDLNSDKIGAVEVPVAAVAKLPPLQAAPAGPAPVKMKTTATDGLDGVAPGSAPGAAAAPASAPATSGPQRPAAPAAKPQ